MGYTKTIDHIDRLRNSANGNPRYRIVFTDGSSADTQPNSTVAYSLLNREHFEGPVNVFTTPAGKVYDVRPTS